MTADTDAVLHAKPSYKDICCMIAIKYVQKKKWNLPHVFIIRQFSSYVAPEQVGLVPKPKQQVRSKLKLIIISYYVAEKLQPRCLKQIEVDNSLT